jgi:hypothetical protein
LFFARRGCNAAYRFSVFIDDCGSFGAGCFVFIFSIEADEWG